MGFGNDPAAAGRRRDPCQLCRASARDLSFIVPQARNDGGSEAAIHRDLLSAIREALPLTNHHSPITTHQSLITNHVALALSAVNYLPLASWREILFAPRLTALN
jgi:hypothetical protein